MTQIRVVDGKHQVYFTTNGIDQRDIGPRWETPREAIDYSEQVDAERRAADDDRHDAD